MATSRVIIGISGLGYGGAGVDDVERALSQTAGVLRVHVNAATEMAYVEYEPATVSPDDLTTAIRASGFEVEPPIPLQSGSNPGTPTART